MISNNLHFKNLDLVCDYCPGISTVSNLTHLYQKYVVLPKLTAEEIEGHHYYRHLHQKHVARCVVLLLPVIGNLIISLVDFAQFSFNLGYKLGSSYANSNSPSSNSNLLKATINKVQTKVKKLIKWNQPTVQEIVQEGIILLRKFKTDPTAIFTANPVLFNHPDFMLELLKINSDYAVYMISERLLDHSNFMLQALRIESNVIYYASLRLKDDLIFISNAMKINPQAHYHASKKIRFELLNIKDRASRPQNCCAKEAKAAWKPPFTK